jgi:hypothetical protein
MCQSANPLNVCVTNVGFVTETSNNQSLPIKEFSDHTIQGLSGGLEEDFSQTVSLTGFNTSTIDSNPQ